MLKQDPLIGRRVRAKADLLTTAGDKPHHAAGKVGTVLTRNPTGSYQVDFEDKVWVLHMEDFTVEDQAAGTASGLVEVQPELAVSSPTNPRARRGLDVDSISALAASIKVHGLGQPILVRPLPAERLAETAEMSPRPIYELIAGERRWRACMVAGLATMPMLVRDMSDAAVLEMQLVENVEREDLDVMDEAEGYEALRVKLGYTVEQIAERIGRGKGESYVLKTLKLCALTPESREAMYPGPNGEKPILGRSTGLLVARYEPQVQKEAVAFITSLRRNGEPAPFREVAPALHKRFNLALATAPFRIDDAALVPACGACTACPKRTAAQPDLYGDEKGTDSCMDADCFEVKRQAHIQQVREQAQKGGLKLVDGEDARRARPTPHQKALSGYVRLTDTAEVQTGDDGKEREVTFEDKLRALGKRAPKPRLFIDPHSGKAEKVITAELAEKLVPDDEERPGKPPASSQEGDTRPPEQAALDSHHVRRALLLRLFDAVRARPRTADELRLVLKVLILDQEGANEALRYCGLQLTDGDDQHDAEAVEAFIDAQLPEQMGKLLVMAAIEIVFGDWDQTALLSDRRIALASSYGIDVLAVRDKVAEDLERASAQPLEVEA